MDYKLIRFEKHSDNRGDLIVFLKQSQLSDERKQFGQIYFVTFKQKGIVRGNHYHKKWHEWFGIVAGEVEVTLKDVNTGEVKTLVLDANNDKYMRLEIGPYIAHSIKSISEYAALLNYADSEWSQDDSISYQLS